MRNFIVLILSVFLVACASIDSVPRDSIQRLPEQKPSVKQKSSSLDKSPADTLLPPATKQGRNYYLDDGPLHEKTHEEILAIPDAVPKDEKLQHATLRPYVVLNRTYTPLTQLTAYTERGIATWYGKRYHGQKTSSGELYDMYGMTAAHTTLPLPCYVQVTNLANQKYVIVKVNDRGPFLNDRLIDLSYAAAYKLDILKQGQAMVEVNLITPDQYGTPNVPSNMAKNAIIPIMRIVKKPENPLDETSIYDDNLFIEIVNFSNKVQVETTAKNIVDLKLGLPAIRLLENPSRYELELGPYKDLESAEIMSDKIQVLLDIPLQPSQF